MKIKVLLVVYTKGGKALTSKEQEMDVGDGYNRQQVEDELIKVNEAANKKYKSLHLPMSCTMTLIELGGIPL